MTCPNTQATKSPVTSLTDTGYSAKTKLRLTVTLRQAAATSAAQVCFQSTKPFKSQSPTTSNPGGGTGLLLTCAATKKVAPCVVSSKQVGTSIVATFEVRGGDPKFAIEWPAGRQSWLSSKSAIGTVGTPYGAAIHARGGRAPYHWKKLSGHLPPGVTLNPSTGSITGTPTAKGIYTAGLQASDSSSPPQKTQSQSVPITIKPAAS